MSRLPSVAHTSRPWRIHDIARDLRIEDVWALPTPGGPDGFPALVEGMATSDPSESSSGASRLLWAIRERLGELLGWDDKPAGAASLRDRLPPDLRATPMPEFSGAPFSPLYMTDDEF